MRPPDAAPSYIPSIESPSARGPFDSDAVGRAARGRQRLHPHRRLDGRHAHRSRPPVAGSSAATAPRRCSTRAPARRTGTSTFKNFVVSAGLRPKAVVFFFRDENLTDTLFRVYPSAAGPRGQERGAGARRTPRGAVAGHVLPAARRRPPRLPARPDAGLARAPHRPCAGRGVGRPTCRGSTLLDSINNEVFTLEALRPMVAADMAAAKRRGARLRPEPPHLGPARDPPPVEGVRDPRRVRPGPAPAGRGRAPAAVGRAPASTCGRLRRYLAVERSDLPRRLGRSGSAALDLRGRRSREEGLPEDLHGDPLPEEPGDLPVIFHSLDFADLLPAARRRRTGRCPAAARTPCCSPASYVFYGWVHPWFLLLIAATTVVDYGAALGMDRRPARRKACLWLALAANLGLLGFFRYFNFFADNVAAVLAMAGWHVPRSRR
ncbi:MAG: hypothetical protein M0C28_16320 [Candidatus Moduliflexus flocculans]|nr:hypothetical protein [Candidatus Moduliflexus flocculans]